MHLENSALLRGGIRYAAGFSSALLRQRAFPQARTRLWTEFVKPYDRIGDLHASKQ